MSLSVTIERLHTLTDKQVLLQQGRARIESLSPRIPGMQIEPDVLQSLTTAIEQGRCAAWSCSAPAHQARSMLIAIPTALDPASPKAQFFPGRYAMLQFSCRDADSIGDIFPLYTETCRFLQDNNLTVHRCSVYSGDGDAREIWSDLGFGKHHCHASAELDGIGKTASRPAGITIRPAVDADYSDVQQLFMRLVRLHNQSPILQPEPKRAAELYNFSYLLSDPDSLLLVVEHNAQVIGYLDGYISSDSEGYLSPLVEPPYAYVRNLYVDSEHRGRGIGSCLLHHFADWCSGNSLRPHRIHVDYRTANIPAAAFWRRNQFEPLMIGMLRRLPRQRSKFFGSW